MTKTFCNDGDVACGTYILQMPVNFNLNFMIADFAHRIPSLGGFHFGRVPFFFTPARGVFQEVIRMVLPPPKPSLLPS